MSETNEPKLEISEEKEFKEQIETAYDFFKEITAIDEWLKNLEKEMEFTLNLLDPDSLKKFLEQPLYESKKILPNGAIACRIVTRQLINDIKSSGINVDFNIEATILKAMPFCSGGFFWKVANREVSNKIVDEHQEALEQFYKLPEVLAISQVASETRLKLQLLNSYRVPGESIIMLKEGMKELDSKIEPLVRQIVSDASARGSQEDFLNHELPYAIGSIAPLEKRKYMTNTVEDERSNIRD